MYSTRAPDFALLVCTTICLFAGACKEDDAGPPTSPHQEIIGKLPSFPEGSGVIEYDHWYRAWLQGRPTGSHRVTVRTYPTEEGSLRLAETKTRMTMRIGTEVSRMAFEERILVDEKHRLLRLVSTEHEAGAEPVAVRAGKLGDQMVTVRGPEIRKVPWDATSVNTKSYGVFFPDHPPRKGEVKNSRTYNTEQGAYCDVRMEVVEVSAAEKTYTLEQTSPSLPGAVTRVKLDEKLEPLDVEMRMGSLTIRFERVAEQPRSADIEAWVPDLSSLTTIPVE